MPKIGEALEITPKELGKFSKDMRDEILDAQKDGWRGHINRQGHAMMLSPDGVDTVVVSSNREAINQLKLGINRYRRRMGEEVVEERPKQSQKWPCARPGCPKSYATERHLNLHIAVDHEGLLLCPEPDCDETFSRPQSLGRHRQVKHGYVSPHKPKRKRQEVRRAELKEQLQNLRDAGLMSDESEESTGRENDGSKFDVKLSVENFINKAPSEVSMDSMPIKSLVDDRDKESLKHLAMSVTEFNPPLLFKQNIETAPDVDPHDVEMQIHKQVSSTLKGVRKDEPENKIDFIDERDSWTLDLGYIDDMPIRDVMRVMYAAGMNLEMRVWKDDSDGYGSSGE